MELKTCRNCKRLYNHFSGDNLCPNCVSELEEMFRTVKAYVYDHPNASIQEVADEHEISIRTIHGWIREERLEFAGTSTVGLPCEACGTLIKSGKYCDACKKSMVENLSNMYKPQNPATHAESKKTDNRMRYL